MIRAALALILLSLSGCSAEQAAMSDPALAPADPSDDSVMQDPAPSRVPEPPEPPEADLPPARDSATFEVTVPIDCEVAAWFVYHPDDLAHRARSPEGWWRHGFAVEKELAAARLIGVDTGSDGGFMVRFTDRRLDEREAEFARHRATFPLRVSQGRLFLGNGDFLPSSDPTSDPFEDPEGWLDVPNGDYAVRVHALDWAAEPGAVDDAGVSTKSALPSYVAVFHAVDDLAKVRALPRLPIVTTHVSPAAAHANNDAAAVARRAAAAGTGTFVFVESNEPMFPERAARVPLSDGQYTALREERGWTVAVGSASTADSIVVVIRASSLEAGSAGQWLSGRALHAARIYGEPERTAAGAVRVTALPVTRSAGSPPPVEVRAVLDAFARYAADSAEYVGRIPHSAFEAERVASLDDPLQILYAVSALTGVVGAERDTVLTGTVGEGFEVLATRLRELMSEDD